MVENLKPAPGVEAVALAGWPPLSWKNCNELVSINNAPQPMFRRFSKRLTAMGWNDEGPSGGRLGSASD
jgi:hypothetical protein